MCFVVVVIGPRRPSSSAWPSGLDSGAGHDVANVRQPCRPAGSAPRLVVHQPAVPAGAVVEPALVCGRVVPASEREPAVRRVRSDRVLRELQSADPGVHGQPFCGNVPPPVPGHQVAVAVQYSGESGFCCFYQQGPNSALFVCYS